MYGPEGLEAFINRLRSVYTPWLSSLPFPLKIQELNNDSVSFKEWRVIAKTMQHSRHAIGFRFEYMNHVLAVSGDTDYCEGVIDLCQGASTVILECSTPDDQKVEGHLTPSLAGRIAEKARCKRLVLTHLYPPCDDIPVLSITEKTFSGEVIIAEDLMVLDI